MVRFEPGSLRSKDLISTTELWSNRDSQEEKIERRLILDFSQFWAEIGLPTPSYTPSTTVLTVLLLLLVLKYVCCNNDSFWHLCYEIYAPFNARINLTDFCIGMKAHFPKFQPQWIKIKDFQLHSNLHIIWNNLVLFHLIWEILIIRKSNHCEN